MPEWYSQLTLLVAQDARTITSGRVEVMRSINALIELLNATVGEASPQLMFLAPAERNQMRERLEHSSPLKRRIDTLVTYIKYLGTEISDSRVVL